MIGATVQLVAGFMAHPTFGINALAADLPRNAFTAPGDTPVERDAPPTVAVYNDTEQDGLTFERGYKPPEFPAIIVVRETRELESGASPENARAPNPKQIGVVVAYVTDEKADQLSAQADCELLLRAAERSLRRYKSQSNSDGYRELNGIRVMNVTRWKRVEEPAALDVTRFWGWIEVELQVVDSIA